MKKEKERKLVLVDDLQRDMPKAIDIEEAVLGALINESNAYSRVADIIDESCFYVERNKIIFNTIKELYEGVEPIDILTIVEKLKNNGDLNRVGGAFTIAELSQKVLSSAHIEHHAHIIAEKALARKMIEYSGKIQAASYIETNDIYDVLHDAQSELFEIAKNDITKTQTLESVLNEVNTRVALNQNEDTKVHVTKTGFDYIDKDGGLQGSDLIVLAGNTSMGKTSFFLSVLVNVLKQGDKAAAFSLEMSDRQLVSRLISQESGVKSNRILNSMLTPDELSAFNSGLNVLYEYRENLFFNDKSTSSLYNILNEVRKLKKENDIKGFVVDYLQLVQGQGIMKREEFIGRAIRAFKNIAKELDIWVIVLCQLNRKDGEYVPSLPRLRDSGQIEEAADIVWMIYRPDYYNKKYGENLSYPYPFSDVETQGTAMILVAKGRNIGDGSFICGFDAERTLFFDLPQETLPKKMATTTMGNRTMKHAVSVVPTKQTISEYQTNEDLPF